MALSYLVSSVNYSVLQALTKLVYYLKNKPAKAEASVYFNLAIVKFMEQEKFPGIFLFVFVMSSITSL